MLKLLCLTTLVSFLIQAAPPKASIAGVVLREGTNEPLPDVRVILNSRGPKAFTGGDGRFSFNDLDPGQYTLRFNLNGYLSQNYGERIFEGSSTSVTVRAGSTANNLVMRMTPSASISGRIRNESLQPLVGVPVR